MATPFAADGSLDLDACARARAPPRRARLRGARARGHDRRGPDADRRREARAVRGGARRGRLGRARDRQHRHLRHRALGAPHARGAAARRARLPGRHAVLQQAAGRGPGAPLRGHRGGRRRPAGDHLQHPAARDPEPRAAICSRGSRARARTSSPSSRRRPTSTRRARSSTPASCSTPATTTCSRRSSSSAGRAASASPRTSSAREMLRMCELAEAGDFEGVRALDRELAPVYDALAHDDQPDSAQGGARAHRAPRGRAPAARWSRRPTSNAPCCAPPLRREA